MAFQYNVNYLPITAFCVNFSPGLVHSLFVLTNAVNPVSLKNGNVKCYLFMLT